MKDVPLVGIKAVEDPGSDCYVVHFMFEPHIIITGTMGKVITLKIGRKATAKDVADYLIKSGHMLYEELQKG